VLNGRSVSDFRFLASSGLSLSLATRFAPNVERIAPAAFKDLPLAARLGMVLTVT